MTPRGSAVTRVVDYEPGIAGSSTAHPAGTPSTANTSNSTGPRLRTARAAPPCRPAPSAPGYREAGAFVDAALRTILEVIDRRRQPVQLAPLMVAELTEAVLRFTRSTTGRDCAAMLRRVRLQPCGPGGQAFEVAAAYSRKARLHAIACRVERVSTPTGVRWQIVALQIG